MKANWTIKIAAWLFITMAYIILIAKGLDFLDIIVVLILPCAFSYADGYFNSK